MFEEANAIKHLFVEHKDNEVIEGYNHKGWKSLVIHGISEDKTRHYKHYGFKEEKEANYIWTSISEKCHVTTSWLKKVFPMENYNRIRFMLLEPGGYILPHKDGYKHELGKINIALNHPKDCIFKMKEHGVVPMKPGVVMLLDVYNEHAYMNNSSEDRIHIIIHPSDAPNQEYKELVEKSYKKEYDNRL